MYLYGLNYKTEKQSMKHHNTTIFNLAVLLYFLILLQLSVADWLTTSDVLLPHVTALDSSSNTYTGGLVNDQTQLNKFTGYLTKHNSEGQEQWITKFSGNGNSRVEDVFLDEHHNVFCVGDFSGTLSLPGLPVVRAKGESEAFLVKLDTDGMPVWVRSAGSEFRRATAKGVSVDKSGSVYVTGEFDIQISFAGPAINSRLLAPYVAKGGSEVFTAKYSNDGELQWVETAHGSADDHATGIATNSEGTSCVIGMFSRELEIGNSVHLNPAGTQSAFVAEYANDGTPRWSLRLKSPHVKVQSVDTDASGFCYIVGTFEEYLQIGAYPEILARKDTVVSFLVKFSQMGQLLLLKDSNGLSCGEDCHMKLYAAVGM